MACALACDQFELVQISSQVSFNLRRLASFFNTKHKSMNETLVRSKLNMATSDEAGVVLNKINTAKAKWGEKKSNSEIHKLIEETIKVPTYKHHV